MTIGAGGPRYILAGDTGTYSVALQNLGNIDAPYTYFSVGVPVLPPTGTNLVLDNLPYLQFESNVSGASLTGTEQDLPWATLDATNNINGELLTSGYLLDEAAGAFTGFTFNIDTYPGLKALHDHDWEEFKAQIYAAFPQYAQEDILKDGPQDLDKITPGLTGLWDTFGDVPALFQIPAIPFEFNIVATATSMTRQEFVDQQITEADLLRNAILADPTASPALYTLAADQTTWEQMYLASLEETGILLPDGTTPPIRTEPPVESAVATLAAGILVGPAGQQIISTGDLSDFFNDVKTWYGNDPGAVAPSDPNGLGFTANSLSFFGLLSNANAIPATPTFAQFNQNSSLPTTFQAFTVYVPWVPWEQRGGAIPADYAIDGITPDNNQNFFPLNLDQFYANAGAFAGAASVQGPFTLDTNGFVPVGQPLPFTVTFQNDPSAAGYTHQIRITVPLDSSVDQQTFQLGDIQIGNITVHIPAGHSLYQGDFDFTESNGFILRALARRHRFEQPRRHLADSGHRSPHRPAPARPDERTASAQ